MRPRKKDRHLPPCVYIKHGAYWHVKAGKWTRLGTDLPVALREYSRVASKSNTSMEGLLNRWLESIEGKIKPSTLKLYKQSAKRIGSVFAEFEPGEIKPQNVATWMEAESHRPGWANRMRTVLKLVMDRAVLMGLADSNPVTVVPRAEEPERTRYITDAEYLAIRSKADPVLRIVMGLCYFTAQRIGDVLKISLADISDEGIAFKQQKTGVRLIVGMTPEIRELIADAKKLGGNVRGMYLLTYNGKPWRYAPIWQRWNAACRAAKVEDAHIHDLRAKSLTDATRQGLEAMKLAGHTEQKMTDHYVKRRVVPVVKAPKFGSGF